MSVLYNKIFGCLTVGQSPSPSCSEKGHSKVYVPLNYLKPETFIFLCGPSDLNKTLIPLAIEDWEVRRCPGRSWFLWEPSAAPGPGGTRLLCPWPPGHEFPAPSQRPVSYSVRIGRESRGTQTKFHLALSLLLTQVSNFLAKWSIFTACLFVYCVATLLRYNSQAYNSPVWSIQFSLFLRSCRSYH